MHCRLPECGGTLQRISSFGDDGWEDAVVHCPDCGYSVSFRSRLISRAETIKVMAVEKDEPV